MGGERHFLQELPLTHTVDFPRKRHAVFAILFRILWFLGSWQPSITFRLEDFADRGRVQSDVHVLLQLTLDRLRGADALSPERTKSLDKEAACRLKKRLMTEF